MKKLFLSLLLLIALPTVSFADATATTTLTPKSGKLDYMSGGSVAVADQTNGYTQRVDSAGAASVMEYPKTLAASTGSTLNSGTALVSSACRVASITCSGFGTSAGDYALIYDAASATGTPKFECTVGTAKDTNHIIIPGGGTFSTGVFADSNSDNVHVVVSYDN